MDRTFWKGKRVLVTGHTGFKGSWFSLWLQSWGAQVVGYSLPAPTDPSFFETCHIANGMTSIEGDIRDLKRVCAVVKEYRPEIIIHMAAQSLVRYSYEHPVDTYTANVVGTIHVLEAVRLTNSVRVIVNVTSDKCYENREWVWGYRESDPMGGHDPYSSSKGCAELVTNAYRQSYFSPATYNRHGVGLATVRAGNVVGGGDWADDRLVPDILRAVTQQQNVSIRNPNAVRPWQHVLEPLSGYLLLAQRLWEDGASYSEGWNFGPRDDDAKPVSWIVERLTQLWGNRTGWGMDSSEHPHETGYLKLDCSKAWSRLKWQPRWDINGALESIVRWHKAYVAGEDMRAVSLGQIQEYLQTSSG